MFGSILESSRLPLTVPGPSMTVEGTVLGSIPREVA
jgi:hypothetical protein